MSAPANSSGNKPASSNSGTTWKPGDRLVHRARPEWGTGEVISAAAATHEGKACQRLSVRFQRAGLKKLSTALADVAPVDAAQPSSRPAASPQPAAGRPRSSAPQSPPAAASQPTPKPGDAPAISAAEAAKSLVEIPEPATDPFRTIEARLADSLRLYRFTNDWRSLLDWATSQTGIADPMTVLSRHEIETAFIRFRRDLGLHLTELLRKADREKPGLADRLLADLPREAVPDATKAVRDSRARR